MPTASTSSRVFSIGMVMVGCALGASCGASNLTGTWRGASAETRAVDGTLDGDGVEQGTSDITASNDDAHTFVFNSDGTGTVTTRAIFNLVGLNYLELDTETQTPLTWLTDAGGATLTITTDDGVSGEWQVSGDVVLERVVRVDLSDTQFTTRTTTLTLRR